jgi:hypothetical protein
MMMNVIHVVVADDRDVLLAVGTRRHCALRGMKELWRFVVGGGCEHRCCRVIIARRLEILLAVIVVVADDFHLDVCHALHLGVIVHRSQRKPMVLVVIQVQITFSYRNFSHRFILLQMSITFEHVHRQVSEFTRNLEREFFAEEWRLIALCLRSTDFLLIEGDGAVDIAIGG